MADRRAGGGIPALPGTTTQAAIGQDAGNATATGQTSGPRGPYIDITDEYSIGVATEHYEWYVTLTRHDLTIHTPKRPGDSPRQSALAEAAAEWRTLVNRLKPLSRLEQAQQVQAYFKRFDTEPEASTYTSSAAWATPLEIMWATPLEIMIAGAGDSEEIAVAKFLLLSAIGFDDSDIRLLLVADTTRHGEHHAVVLANRNFYSPRQKMVLDSLRAEIGTMADIRQYRPIYGLNRASLWGYDVETSPPGLTR